MNSWNDKVIESLGSCLSWEKNIFKKKFTIIRNGTAGTTQGEERA